MRAAYLTKRPEIGKVPDLLQVGDIAAPPCCISPSSDDNDANSDNINNDDSKNKNGYDLKDGQVLVRVKAACVNVDDMHLQEGTFVGGVPFLQAPVQTEAEPRVVGFDFAGVVEAVGGDTDNIKVGDAACGIVMQAAGRQQGTWAERLLLVNRNAASLVRIPETDQTSQWTYVDWASLVMPAFVATTMYKDGSLPTTTDANTSSDEEAEGNPTTPPLRCLVVGASGGIGSILVQLLAAHKAHVHVTGVCGPTNVGLVKGLGADEVWDYTQMSLTEHLERSEHERFDRVFDLLGGMDLEEEAYGSLLAGSGRFVTGVGPVKYIGDTKLSAWEQFKYFHHIFLGALLRRTFQRDKPAYHMSVPLDFTDDMLRLVAEANVRPVVDRVVPFEKGPIVEAVKLVQSHRAKGRVVLAIDAADCKRRVY